MFSKRHYEFIARTIKDELGEPHTRLMVATMFNDRFKKEEPRFNPATFLRACGLTTQEIMEHS